MFGHQDNTDNNDFTNQHNEDQVDNHIQEFNGYGDHGPNTASPQPSQDYPQQSDLPMIVNPPNPAPVSQAQDDSNGDINQVPQTNNLPDQQQDQPVDLVGLKTKALDELYPIIHKLDLSAEDNFKTLMMMIQATDNKDLIAQAYEAAERIDDEGSRAKALLDIVNEINYFTNHPSIDQ